MACDWLNMKGSFLPSVIDGASHCRPGGRCGVVGHFHLGRLLRGLDGQLAAEHLVGRGQFELQRAARAIGGDGLDLDTVSSRVSSTSWLASFCFHSSV